MKSAQTNRRTRIHAAAALIVAAAGLASAPRHAGAVSYTFVKIADNTGPLGDFIGGPSVNNSGVVAFANLLDSGAWGIYTGSGGPLTTIADTTGSFASLGTAPSINDTGMVAFYAMLDAGGRGIFAGDGGPIATVAQTDSSFSGFLDPPRISNAGTIVFNANLLDGHSGLFSRNVAGGPTSTLYLNGMTFPPFTYSSFSTATINSSGVIAFFAGLFPNPSALFKGSGSGSTVMVGDPAGPLSVVGPTPSINDSGTVAFWGIFDSGAHGIFTSTTGPITTITTTATGPYSALDAASGIDINNAGTVAFYTSLTSGGQGIFTGPDAVADKVIRTGDPLFGGTVANLTFIRGLNDRGDIAFRYVTSPGNIKGVALALASPPPQPADLDADGHVSGIDLALLLGAWTGTTSYTPCPRYAPADLNHDCKVNGLDLALLLGSWNP